jgi:hypothetical protein
MYTNYMKTLETKQEHKKFLERSARTGKFFKENGLEELSNIVDYAIEKSRSQNK